MRQCILSFYLSLSEGFNIYFSDLMLFYINILYYINIKILMLIYDMILILYFICLADQLLSYYKRLNLKYFPATASWWSMTRAWRLMTLQVSGPKR